MQVLQDAFFTEQINKEEYEKIKHISDCKLNHIGSSPSMENDGDVSICSRSIENRGLRYLFYYGDGDSKSFASFQNIYEGAVVKTFECIGHYPKRVGNRLRKLKKRVKGLGGKGESKKDPVKNTVAGKITKPQEKPKLQLTDPRIDRLQNYFGIALRSNLKTVSELRNALIASFSMWLHLRIMIFIHIAHKLVPVPKGQNE